MERNTQKNGLVNLVVAGLMLVAAVAAATLVQSLAGFAASAFLLIGALVTFVSWFQMRLEENERNEKLELDELARSRGTSLFEAKDSGSFPARNAREQFEKFIVPAFAVLLLLIEGMAVWVLWRLSAKYPVTVIDSKATASLSLFAIFALVLFLFGRFSVTIARLEKNRLLQPGAGFLLAAAYVCAVAALGIAGVEAKHVHADFWMARVLCVLLGLLAFENILTLLLEIYRPRVKGKIARPLYDSRVAGLLAQPESLFTTAAQTLDYQFGFKVSETWIFQALQKNLPAFLLVQITVLIVSTMFVFVNAGEQVVLEHCGKPAAVFGPGAHMKLPWPIDKAYRFRTDQIQSFAVGYTPDEKNDSPIVLWTVAHSKEDNFLVGNRTVVPSDTDTNAQPVGLISVSIPVQFQIVNVTNWIYQNATPDELLQNLATREVVHYLAGSDMNDLLSYGRLAAADTLREKIQSAADARNLGVKIIFVGLQDIHPPTEKDLAATYEQVVSAEEKTNTTILNAQSAAIATNYAAEATAYSLTNLADAARIRAQTQAFARAAAFTNQIPAFEAAPSVYRQRQYLQAFAEATAGARKYVLLVTNTSDVVIFDLEDKVRADLGNLIMTNTTP
ncbi:MAG TPA: SPFH domain-containing protein [Candidatus Sulfotelmatobacter sp.]|nr:SPFH domain-containing protein [Candidatus Sulfotelmatobacter sp.]